MANSHPNSDDIRAAALERWAEPDAQPERINVTLIGGPAHGQVMEIRADRRRIETTYTTVTDAPAIRGDGMRPEPVQVLAVTLIYLRANEDAPTAEYHDMELDG